MPDSAHADNTIFSSSFWDVYLRQQVIAQVGSRQRAASEHTPGRIWAETDTSKLQLSTGSTWTWMGGFGAWDDWPTTPASTNFTATWVAKYMRSGTAITFYAIGTMTVVPTGTNPFNVTLPVPAAANDVAAKWTGHFQDVSGGVNGYYPAVVSHSTIDLLTLRPWAAGGTYAAGTDPGIAIPFTWVPGDLVCFGGMYTAASA